MNDHVCNPRWDRRALATARLAALAAVERRVPFWPSERVASRQRRNLTAILRHAYATVPFYRSIMEERGLRPEDFRSVADLTWLPIVERDQVQRDPDAFLSTVQPRERSLKLRTSGSTGEPRAVYHDAAALLANAAHGERDRAIVARLVGRPVGYREAVIVPPISAAQEVQRFVGSHLLVPRRARIDRRYLSLLDPPAEHARQIEAFRPDVLHGFGSALALLAAHHAVDGGPHHRPKAITYSSDALSAPVRRSIEETYGVPVLATYQAIEALKIGFECERRRGYHLNVDLYPVRIVDEAGRELPPGEPGEVVVSNLVNRATVLLNYRLGDQATLATEPCPCGRSLPLLASLDGRCDDAIALPSGRIVHAIPLRNVFAVEPGLWQYQLVQETPAHFRVAVVVAANADRPLMRERLIAGLAERLVDPVEIDVAFVESIERTSGGKTRPIVSRCGGGSPWTEPRPGTSGRD